MGEEAFNPAKYFGMSVDAIITSFILSFITVGSIKRIVYILLRYYFSRKINGYTHFRLSGRSFPEVAYVMGYISDLFTKKYPDEKLSVIYDLSQIPKEKSLSTVPTTDASFFCKFGWDDLVDGDVEIRTFIVPESSFIYWLDKWSDSSMGFKNINMECISNIYIKIKNDHSIGEFQYKLKTAMMSKQNRDIVKSTEIYIAGYDKIVPKSNEGGGNQSDKNVVIIKSERSEKEKDEYTSKWIKKKESCISSVDYIYIPDKFKESIMDDIKSFKALKDDNEAIKIKYSYILWGEGGTGKTTFAKTLAGVLNVPIYCIIDYNMLSKDNFQNLIDTISIPAVLVFEEVDKFFNNMESYGIDKPIINNILDGVGSRSGIFTIMTTNVNYLDLIKDRDTTLFRQGRIDKTINYTKISKIELIDLINDTFKLGLEYDTFISSEKINLMTMSYIQIRYLVLKKEGYVNGEQINLLKGIVKKYFSEEDGAEVIDIPKI